MTELYNKISDYKKAIIAYLQPLFPDFFVDDFVKNPSDFFLRHPRGAILVHYNGSNYSETNASDVIYQERKLSFELIISMKNLQKDQKDSDIQDVIDYVRHNLTGFCPLGSCAMRPVTDRFISEESGTWLYGLSFEVPAFNIQKDEIENEPIIYLRRVTAQADGYDPVITESSEEI